MTTVFVYEDVSAQGADGDHESPPAPSLLAEGRAMRAAVTADFQAVPGVHVTGFDAPASNVGRPVFREMARAADFSLVIAPECGGRLEQLCREVLAVGGELLGPTPDAIRRTADKWALACHWEQHRVPTPRTWEPGRAPADIPVVRKPRDGAGSQGIRLVVPSPQFSHREASKRAAAPDDGTMWIVQEYIPGQSASVAFLIGPGSIVPLIPCEQLLTNDGRFGYRGGRLPIAADLARRALRVATAAVECIPGLCGYVGVDVVLGEDGIDRAIEVNPRITTSYVGLRALARFNLAEAMLAAVRGDPFPEFRWHAGPIEFRPDGALNPVESGGG